MTQRFISLLWASAALATGLGLGGCDGDEEEEENDTPLVRCQVEDAGGAITGCNEHTIPGPAIEESKQACIDEGGTLVDECPSAGYLGQCSYASAGIVFNYYEAIGDTSAELEEDCVGSGGDWSPP